MNGPQTKQADRIVSLTPNIIEVCEVLDNQLRVEADSLVKNYVFGPTGEFVGQRDDSHQALTLAGTFVQKDTDKVAIVRARGLEFAEFIYARNKGIGY